MRSVIVLGLGCALAALTASCGNATGARCTTSAECQAGLVCVATGASDDGGTATRLCMRRCDYDGGNGLDQRLCNDGLACLTLEGIAVCYPGGTHPIHETCTTNVECESGTVCAPDNHVCEQTCTLTQNAPCRARETCTAVGTEAVCRSTVVVVDEAGIDASLDASVDAP